jgi:hypothetical protein
VFGDQGFGVWIWDLGIRILVCEFSVWGLEFGGVG